METQIEPVRASEEDSASVYGFERKATTTTNYLINYFTMMFSFLFTNLFMIMTFLRPLANVHRTLFGLFDGIYIY